MDRRVLAPGRRRADLGRRPTAGEGGMGQVFAARDRQSGERVALKLTRRIAAREAERFSREAELLAELSHPGIVRYVAHGVGAGRPYLAMEWLEGEDLAQRLERKGLSLWESVSVVAQAAEALGAAHARGIVHRDVKPSNLFLVGGDATRVKVLDSGVAWLRGAKSLTRTGLLVGTPGYMAPEQARGSGEVDARTDVFALGCVLFECLTGRPAFVGEHVAALLARILFEESPRASDLSETVPAEIDGLCACLLAKEPAERPADGAAVARALRAWEPTVELPAVPVAVPDLPSDPTASLGGTERRALSVVLASPGSPAPAGDVAPSREADTLADLGAASFEALRAEADAHGARLEALADGSLVAVLTGSRVLTDLAAQAARCALSLRARLTGPMALATGRAEIAAKLPVGGVVERAAALLRLAPEGVRLDETTAGLLGMRFDVRADAAGLWLRDERQGVEPARTLLGKATPFVGRDRELDLLTGLYDGCVEEASAHAVLVLGAPGVGKSRLRYELLRRLKERGEPLEVWVGRGDTVSVNSPFIMIAPPLARSAGVQEGEPVEAQRLKLSARVARSVAATERARVTAFLGELVGVHFPVEHTPELELARRDAIVMGDHMRLAWQDFLEAETAEHPVVLVLEDLHWGDRPSVRLIDLALRNLAERPWLVVAFARPEVREAFPDLWAERAVQVVHLGDLRKKARERLVRSVLGSEVSDSDVERITERSEGNAFYLEELVRAHAADRGESLPETVIGMVEARLSALDPEFRRVARAASVFGKVFWTGAVAALLGGGDQAAHMDAMLRRLAAEEVIARMPQSKFSGEAEWAFRHANLRDAAYAMLTDADRALGHKLAGGWLEGAGETDAAAIAEHYEKGADRERAQGMYLRAAREALEADDLRAAIDRAERAVHAGAEGKTLGELRLVQAEARLWLGDNVEVLERARAAHELLEAGGAGWFEAVRIAAGACTKLGRLDEAIALADLLGATPPLPGAEVACGAGRAAAAVHLLFYGVRERAERLLASVDAARADARARGFLAVARAQQAVLSGNPVGLFDETDRAAALFGQLGDRGRACLQLVSTGYALTLLGDAERAIRVLEQARVSAERMGLAAVVAAARNNLGPALAANGRLVEARAVEEEAAAECARQGDRRMEGVSRCYLAGILLGLGELDAAEGQARLAVELLAGVPPELPYALAVLARILLARGDVARARAAIGEAMQGVGAVEEGEGTIRLVHAEVLHAAGELDGARAAVREAREHLLARAARISPEWRESFLERVPDHARTLALAKEWLSE